MPFVATTVLSAAASQDLTDLATAKDELGLTTADVKNDGWLGRAITQVSRAIATYTNRVFAPELVQDAILSDRDAYPSQTPGGSAVLQLRRWPVLQVFSAVQLLAAGQTQTLVDGSDFRTDAEAGQLKRLAAFTGAGTTWETLPITVQYLAGYGTLVQEAHMVPAAPFQVATGQPLGCDVSVTGGDGTALTRVAGAPAAGQYGVGTTGYTFAAADAGRTLFFLYASPAIPADVTDACLQLISNRFAARGRDPALVEEETAGIGRKRYWIGTSAGQDGPFSPDIAALLDPYRVPALG